MSSPQMSSPHLAASPGELAQAVEAAGFDAVWFPDHTHVPIGATSKWPGDPTSEAPSYYADIVDIFIALASAAAATTRIRIGSAICVLPQRDPIIAAKQAASIDCASGGRLTFGVGPGWNAEEMANHGASYRDRYPIMREYVQAMKTIWSNDIAEFHGKHANFEPIRSGPKPVQAGGPPILIAGESEKTQQRVIAYGDGWLPRGRELLPLGLVKTVRSFRCRCVESGRGPLPVVILDTALNPTNWPIYCEAEVEEIIFRLPPTPAKELTPNLYQLKDLASQIIGSFKP